MKKTISTLCVLVIYQWAIAQHQLTISSGYGVSSTLCGNRKVYTWGNNQQQIPAVTGILGNGSTAALLSIPTEVVFPVSGGVNIKQISSGGGSHFLAVDCNGNVWSWGSNLSGQLGNGNTTTTTLPALVKPGNGPSANVVTNAGTVSALSQVTSVCGGMSSSFAILDDRRLLSWGCNSVNCNPDASGILGSGTTVDRSTPGFVLSGSTNQPLTGVLQVQAGDNVAYALVDDNSELGTGIVYSWGNGQSGSLGRNANGTGNSRTLFQVQSSVAFPVRKLDGSALDNIVAISAGAVFCLALDSDGYVWAWGNGGWGGCTGQGLTISHSDPRRVIKGNVTGAGTDGTYLLARSIGGGQGFAMAVTLDGKPVAWGNNGGPVGGFLGNGGTLSYSYPVYVLNNGQTEPHSDVVSVNKGVLNGFYQRADGSIWAWGGNSKGELGIGNTTDQLKAVPFSPPMGCSILDPFPYANIFPKDTIVCASRLYSNNPIKLDPKFAISPSLAPKYSIAWYRYNVPIPNTSGTISTKGVTYNANQEGIYRVEINYTGTNGPCLSYTKAISETVINTFPQTFTAPSNLQYCSSSAIVHVNSTSTTSPVYKWYPNTSSQNSIGSSSSSGDVTLDVSNVTAASNGDKIVYVEEKLSASGRVTPAIDPSTTFVSQPSGNVSGNTGNDMYFTVHQNLTIDTISIQVQTITGSYATANFQFKVYGTTQSCGGKLVADRTNIIASGPTIATIVTTSMSTIKIPVNISLIGRSTGIGYFIGITTNLNGSFRRYNGIPAFTYSGNDMSVSNTPMVDNVNGNTIKVYGSDEGDCYPNPGTFGSFFNWQFTTGQKYCDRVPVVLKQCTITGQDDEDNISSTLMVAPNPFKEYFLLEVQNTNKLQVYNASGELIEEQIALNEGRITLGQNWSKGLYLIQLTGNGTFNKIKVIKED